MNGGQSRMRSERVDEVLLVKYLLGNLTEEEQVYVENRAFADANHLGALEAAEADLIDAYVRGQLSQAERRGFERQFLTSPSRRNKVEFARALARVASESRAVRLPTAWQTLLSVVRGWSPAVQVAAGLATVVFAAGGSWLIVQNTSMRSRVTVLEAQRRDLEIREQELRHELAVHSQQQSTTRVGVLPPVVASLVFSPGLTRAETRVEQLVLNPSVQIAHVEIQLESRDDYPRFRVELRKRSGDDVLTQGNLPKRRTTVGYSVSFDVPASALLPGEYELALKGLLDDQSVQDVAYYYFSVQEH